MKHKSRLIPALAALCGVATLSAPLVRAQDARPNILVIATDDLRYLTVDL